MTSYASGGLIDPQDFFTPGGCVLPQNQQVYVGDVPSPSWPGQDWRWNPLTMTWEYWPNQGLTWTTGTTSIDPMGRAEVIEFTHDFEGGDSTSVKHVWWNSNTERLTVEFIRGGGAVSGGIYSYDGVDYDLYTDFKDSPSYGAFFHSVFTPKGDDKWPGVKHDELRVKFAQVDDEESREVIADLDALKPNKLTMGKGKAYELEFTYSARGRMEVRARDAGDAIQTFLDYMRAEGFTVTSVTTTDL